jgi:two-component system chemotaxis response regulator CheB
MPGRDIIVVGASAGGQDALVQLVGGLPPGLPATTFVVRHAPSGEPSTLPTILSRSGPLLASHAHDGEPFHPGHIYIAPPDRHLLLQPGRLMRLTRGPRENNHRPAIDPLFRTAARYYGPRVIGIVLSGSLSDGTAGLLAVRSGGGLAVIQDPADAAVGAMPQNATQIAGADHVVAAADLAPLLRDLVQATAANSTGDSPVADPVDKMPEAVTRDFEQQVRNARQGQLSVLTCPECGGSLWQVTGAELIRYRCHVGHVYNGDVLLAEKTEALEAALWAAVRMFKERGVLARQVAAKERSRGDATGAERFEEQAELAERYGKLIQQYVLEGAPLPGGDKPTGTPLSPAAGQRGRG